MSRQALGTEKACSGVTDFGQVTREAPPEGSAGQDESLRASSGQREVSLGAAGGPAASEGEECHCAYYLALTAIGMVEETGQMSGRETGACAPGRRAGRQVRGHCMALVREERRGAGGGLSRDQLGLKASDEGDQ